MLTKYTGRYGFGEATLVPFKDGMLLQHISIPEHLRGRGHGKWLLEHVLQEADKEYTPIYLIITSTKSPLGYNELRAWYTRHGFRRSQGRLWKRPAPRKPRKWSKESRQRVSEQMRALYAPLWGTPHTTDESEDKNTNEATR